MSFVRLNAFIIPMVMSPAVNMDSTFIPFGVKGQFVTNLILR